MASPALALPTEATTPDRLEALLLSITREVATDIMCIEDILKAHSITPTHFEILQRHPRYQLLLKQAKMEWSKATNSTERLRLKSAVVIEDWLPELNARLHDRNEPLNAKIEGGKLLARLSGIGERSGSVNPGEMFKITINLGEDRQLKIEKELPSRVVDGERVD